MSRPNAAPLLLGEKLSAIMLAGV